MLVYGEMKLILHCSKKCTSKGSARIIVHRRGIDICYLLIEITLRSSNISYALQQLFEVSIATFLQTIVIHCKSLLDILM